MTERSSDPEGSVETARITAGSMGSQPDQGRRQVFRRLVALAGLGITGFLLSQEKTGLLPTVQASTAAYTDTSSPVLSAHNTSTSQPWTGILGNSDGGIGVAGVSSGTGPTSIGVLGTVFSSLAKPLVAQGTSGQSANLQEWQNSSANPLTVVDKDGNFGVGTSSPLTKLHIKGTGVGFTPWTNWDKLVIEDANATIQLVASTSGVSEVAFSDSERNRGLISFNHSEDTMNFDTAGQQRMKIDSSGKVGIGTSAPVDRVHVVAPAGSDANIRFEGSGNVTGFVLKNTGSGGRDWRIRVNKNTITPNGGLVFQDDTAVQPRMVIDASGKVGIGTTSPNPANMLHVAGRVRATGYDTGDITYANGVKTTEEGDGLAFLNAKGNKIAVLDSEGNLQVKGKITENPLL